MLHRQVYKLKKALFVFVHLLLIALILYQGWSIVNVLLFGGGGVQAQNRKMKSAEQPLTRQRPSIESLVDIHFFGTVQQAKTQIIPNPENVPKSTKAYRIASLAVAQVESRASVVLETKPGDMMLLRPGDAIEAGVTLLSILDDAIVIQVNGKSERIDFIRARQPVLIKVKQTTHLGTVSAQEYDWSWVAGWATMTDHELLEKLGLSVEGNRVLITTGSPILKNWNVNAGSWLLSVNGKQLLGSNKLRDILWPLSQRDTSHLLIESKKRRSLVRWQGGS